MRTARSDPQSWRSWRRLAALALAVGVGLAPSAARVARADVYAALVPQATTVAPGDTFAVDMVVTQAGAQFNAFDASIRFDPAMLSFVPITPVADQRGALMTDACASTFHKFSAAPDSLRITLSLLCGGTFVTGPGTVYHVRFRAGTTQGTTTLSLGPFTEFYDAGLFVRPLHTQDGTVTIGSTVDVGKDPGPAAGVEFASPAPNPAHARDAVVLAFALPAPDLVGFDLLDTQGRLVASRGAESYGAGPHRVAWSPPTLASGSYFIRLRARAGGTRVRRWAVLR